MGIAETALSVAKALRYDSASLAELRSEYSRLALEIATNPDGGSDITSATVNGQSFAKMVSMTKSDRLKLIERALWHIDNSIFYTPKRTYYSGGFQS